MLDIASGALQGDYRALLPVLAFSLMAVEFATARLLGHHHTHSLAETASSLTIAVVHKLLRPLEAAVLAIPLAALYQNRLFDIDHASALNVVVLLFAVEFCYYWHHRTAHHVRWFWASHAVHHSPTKLNYTAAVRLSWFGPITGNILFYMPLIWLGFHPLAVIAVLGINLIYQFFIHTELSPRWGPLEWVLNTPHHHQVHHASNPECLDKNFGGILIIYDRIFGTFAPRPAQPLRYGLVEGPQTQNPVWINGHVWWRMGNEFCRSKNWRGRLQALFGRP